MLKENAHESVIRNVANFLKEERLRQNFSMSELAKQAGLSQQMVSYVERRMRIPTLDTLLRICRVLKVPLWNIIMKAETSNVEHQIDET